MRCLTACKFAVIEDIISAGGGSAASLKKPRAFICLGPIIRTRSGPHVEGDYSGYLGTLSLRHHERRPEEALRGKSRVRLLLRHSGPRALPRERLRAEPRGGGGDAHDPLEDPVAR